MALTSQKPSRLFRLLHVLQWGLDGVAKRTITDQKPRLFHNAVLRRYLASLGGAVINVSGWEDRDKEGGFYRDYFGPTDRYVISNVGGASGMLQSVPEGVESAFLDLDEPLPEDMRQAFDVVFSHTVLEHVYETDQALENLAEMSRDVVVTVVPWSQGVHYTESFSDYVRLSPYKLKRFFEDRGFTVLLSTANDQSFFSVYVTMVVSRHPERHAAAFADAPLFYDVEIHPGPRGRFGNGGPTVVD